MGKRARYTVSPDYQDAKSLISKNVCSNIGGERWRQTMPAYNRVWHTVQSFNRVERRGRAYSPRQETTKYFLFYFGQLTLNPTLPDERYSARAALVMSTSRRGFIEDDRTVEIYTTCPLAGARCRCRLVYLPPDIRPRSLVAHNGGEMDHLSRHGPRQGLLEYVLHGGAVARVLMEQ